MNEDDKVMELALLAVPALNVGYRKIAALVIDTNTKLFRGSPAAIQNAGKPHVETANPRQVRRVVAQLAGVGSPVDVVAKRHVDMGDKFVAVVFWNGQQDCIRIVRATRLAPPPVETPPEAA